MLPTVSFSPHHWVCKPAYLVPVASQDKVGGLRQELDSWSLTSLFSTNMAISETNGHSFIEDTIKPSVFLSGIISLVIMCIGII